MNKLSIPLSHKIGDTLSIQSVYKRTEDPEHKLVNYRINEINISWLEYSEPHVIYSLDEYIDNRYVHSSRILSINEVRYLDHNIQWSQFNIDLKYKFGDIVLSGVNNQNPNDISTYKDSGNSIGNVFKITGIRIKISSYKTEIFYMTNNILYNSDGYISDVTETLNNKEWIYNLYKEDTVCLLSDIDFNKLMHIKCEEFAHLMWRNSNSPLYKNNIPVIYPYDSKNIYENKWAGFFNYCNKEDEAIEIYNEYVKSSNKKRELYTIDSKEQEAELDELINSLSDELRATLIKKLLRKKKKLLRKKK